MNNERYKLPHLLLSETATTEKFTSPKSGGKKNQIPQRDRKKHSAALLQQFDKSQQDLKELSKQRKALGLDVQEGICLLFKSDPDFDLQFESLDIRRSGIELLMVKEIDKVTYASVFIPEGKLEYFVNRIKQYRSEETKKGLPKNKNLVESINSIQKATLDSLWADDKALFPQQGERIWWEVWLRSDREDGEVEGIFSKNAPKVGLKLQEERLHFPDRTVILAKGTSDKMSQSVQLLNCISEVRRAKDNPELFMGMELQKEKELVDKANERIVPADSGAVAVCILDTGVNKGHPLIEQNLADSDLHAYDPGWQVTDHHGHGTEMAGLALLGDLVDVFSGSGPIELKHRLESVKILPPAGYNEPKLFGEITKESIARAEVEAPYRKRIYSMAVTAPDNRDRGKPTSWSAAVDNVCSGIGNNQQRLLIISAGNINDRNKYIDYPAINETEDIHDPAQAWNAVTVGAYTEKDLIDTKEYPGWDPIAPAGSLAPASTTSLIWHRQQWPIKPEIVLEGGNLARNSATNEISDLPSLRLLTTNWKPAKNLFTITGDTSAATSLAARMAAILQAGYPHFWPETIRGLLVHSAEWTQEMKSKFSPLDNRRSKENLLRYCGFGVPDLTHARYSADNDLTLIVQNSLYPFEKLQNQYATRDMDIHRFPWPKLQLAELGETEVELKVTLSYFIEPSPGERGWKKRYQYASHGLRFEVKTPLETINDFRQRINKAARDEEENTGTSKSDSSEWLLGPKLRHKGSIHSDRWKGTAIQLAEREYIGIYPVSGWWKERPYHKRWENAVRYSLIVTISTPGVEVDIYTAVANQIFVTIET